MIKSLYFLGLLILSSCTTRIPLGAMRDALIRKYPVNDRTEALALIQSRYNYLKLLFEQSREPYYGENKWTEECLKENVVGPIEDNNSSISMNSGLF
jgi:hypothetical protein